MGKKYRSWLNNPDTRQILKAYGADPHAFLHDLSSRSNLGYIQSQQE